MPEHHDPVRQIGWLQESLRSNKRQIGFLLGAGCPMSVRDECGAPIIPDIRTMTETIVKTVGEKDEVKEHLQALLQQFADDGENSPTIEDILTQVRSLHAVAGKGKVRGLSASSLVDLDTEFCANIHALTDKSLPSTATPYHGMAKWADGKRRGFPVEIFTTNYDLLMEQALEDQFVPFFDGFTGVRRPFFDLRAMEEDQIPSRWVRLWKLHGSINWFQDGSRGVCRGYLGGENGSQRVIHPSHLKYEESRRLPYLAMMDKLRSFLRRDAATLVVCGYSFGDEHINELIVQGLRTMPSSVAFALQYGELDGYEEACKLALKRDNLNLLGKDGAVIGGKRLSWPEKEVESVGSHQSKWIRWIPRSPEEKDQPHKGEMRLGDFAVFGEFLQNLAGAQSIRNEGPNE